MTTSLESFRQKTKHSKKILHHLVKKVPRLSLITVLLFSVFISYSALAETTREETKVFIDQTAQSVTTHVGDPTESSNELVSPTEALKVEGTPAQLSEEEISRMEEKEINNPDFPYELSFIGGSIRPNISIDPKLQTLPAEKEYTYAFIMISGLHTQEKYDELENIGVEILGYHTHHSIKSKIPLNKLEMIASLPFVTWIGYSEENQKLHPSLKQKLNEPIKNPINIFVNLFAPDNAQVANDAQLTLLSKGDTGNILQSQGMNINKYYPGIFTYYGNADKETIQRLIENDFVLFIDEEGELHNELDESLSLVGVDYVRPTYNGLGETVGIIDSGYDASHQDLPTPQCSNYATGSCTSDTENHGTRVAGIILGQGNTNAIYKGIVPSVSTVKFAKVDQVNDWILALNWIMGTPSPSVVSISQGSYDPMTGIFGYSPCTGTETVHRNFDDTILTNLRTVVKSAGNCGPWPGQANCPSGTGGSQTISAPGCSKNLITVGSALDYGEGQTDLVDLSSSRGPTGDGRKKPDMVAPGCDITSTTSGGGYANACGTSFAAPHISGIIASLTDHYTAFTIYPELIKAILAASAIPYQGLLSNINNAYGHGKTDSYLTNYVINDPNGWIWNYDYNGQVTSSGGYWYYQTSVPTDTDRLTLAISWLEQAASAGSNNAVMNNLDLWVDFPPYGATCTSGEYSATSTVDNLEYIYVDSPPTGNVQFKICPTNVQTGLSPQPFSIAWYAIRGNPNPNYNLNMQLNTTQVQIGERFSMTGTVDPGSYVLSGTHLKPLLPPNMSIAAVEIIKEDGTLFRRDSTMFSKTDMDDFTLGDILFTDTRSITWTLYSNTTGQKTVGVQSTPSNSGPATVTLTVNVQNTLLTPGSLCSTANQCQSSYCQGSTTNAARCCTNQPPTDGWYGGGNLGGCTILNDTYSTYRDYYCDTLGITQYVVSQSYTCNTQDGWYNYGDLGPGCLQINDPIAENRDYYVVQNTNTCAYQPCQNQNCNTQDGYYGGGNTNVATCGMQDNDNTSKQIDFYGTPTGTCTSTATNCAQQNCTTQDGWYGGGNTPGCGTDPPSIWNDYYTLLNNNLCGSTTSCTGNGIYSCDGYDICSNNTGTDFYVISNTTTCASTYYPAWSSEIRLTLNQSSDQPSLSTDPLGNAHVAWTDNRDGNREIYYKKLNNNAVNLTPDIRLTFNGNMSLYPSLSTDLSGNVHLIWVDYRNGNYADSEIYYKKLNNNGIALTQDIRITYNSSFPTLPKLATDPVGNVHLTWADYRNGLSEIYYKKLSNSGVNLTLDIRLTFDPAHSEPASIATDLNGNVHIVWVDIRDGNREIYYKKLNNNGTNLTSDLRLTNDPAFSLDPSLSTDQAGNVHIAWKDGRDSPTSYYEIYYKKLNNNGTNLTTDLRLTFDPFYSETPSISTDLHDNVHVSWEDYRDGNREIYYKKLNNNGTILTPDIRLTFAVGESVQSSLDTDQNSNVHIAWSDFRNGSEVYFRRSAPKPNLFFQNNPQLGTTMRFSIIDSQHPNTNYLMAISYGSSPGTPLGDGRTIPLNIDDLLMLSLQYPTLVGFNQSQGILDSLGQAQGTWNIPNFPAAAGLTVYAAFITINDSLPFPQTITSISEAVPITLLS